jgi:hypothetical protein
VGPATTYQVAPAAAATSATPVPTSTDRRDAAADPAAAGGSVTVGPLPGGEPVAAGG